MNLKLRQYRNQMGLTQQELADQVGVSFRTIQSWERDETYPNASHLFKLCQIFKTDPNTLIGWYDEFPQQENAENSKDELKPAFVTLKVNADGSVELVEKAE